MSLTAFRNPLNEAEALVAYCTTKTNLALEHWPIGGTSPNTYADNNVAGPIVSPADFAATRFNNTVAFFGIIKYKDDKGNDKKAVSCISPTLNPIAALGDKIDPGDYQALAATGNEKSKAWVFFLQEGKGTTDEPQIHSAALSPSAVTAQVVLDQCHPFKASRLASAYNAKKDTPTIYFQYGSSGQTNLQWVSLAAKTPNDVDNSTGMADGTPLAVTNVDRAADSNVLTYLYCRNSQDALTVFIYDLNKATWNGPKVLKDAPSVDKSSGLSVVGDTASGQNLLYYKEADGAFQSWAHVY